MSSLRAALEIATLMITSPNSLIAHSLVGLRSHPEFSLVCRGRRCFDLVELHSDDTTQQRGRSCAQFCWMQQRKWQTWCVPMETGRDSWACRLVGRSLPHPDKYIH